MIIVLRRVNLGAKFVGVIYRIVLDSFERQNKVRRNASQDFRELILSRRFTAFWRQVHQTGVPNGNFTMTSSQGGTGRVAVIYLL